MNAPLLVRLARTLDRLPISPASLATRVIILSNRPGETCAKKDVEQLDSMAEHGDADGLPSEGQATRGAVLVRRDGQTRVSTMAGRVQQATFAGTAQRLVTRWQLSRRGWAHQDTWDLDRTLATRLGAQLVNLAETTNGWPGPEKYESPQAWDRALRSAGTALTIYAAAAEDRGEVIRTRQDAKDALRWVADNLEHLWW